MRPEGIGRSGSLMASTCRSNQSLTAWLVAQTSGPATSKPPSVAGHRSGAMTPDETTPQPKAHIGANQVIGFRSTRTGGSADRAMSRCYVLTHLIVNFDLHFG